MWYCHWHLRPSLWPRQAAPGSVPTTPFSQPRSDELASLHGGDLQGPGERRWVGGDLEHAPGNPRSTGLKNWEQLIVSHGALSPVLVPEEEMAPGLAVCTAAPVHSPCLLEASS